MSSNFFYAALITGLGIIIATLGQIVSVFGQAVPTGSENLAPYFVTGSGSAVAVGGLVYFARKIISGELVSSKIEAHIERLMDLIEEGNEIQTRIVNLVEKSNKREDRLFETIRELRSER